MPVVYLMSATELRHEPAYMREHDRAVREGRECYIDPETGYQVWTSLFLKQRGLCCGSGCRHCPYGTLDEPRPLESE